MCAQTQLHYLLPHSRNPMRTDATRGQAQDYIYIRKYRHEGSIKRKSNETYRMYKIELKSPLLHTCNVIHYLSPDAMKVLKKS